MIYLSVLCAVLALYIVYLQLAWRKTKRNLKELIIENDKHTTTRNEADGGDMYFKTDLDFIITYVNEATLKKTGFKSEELIGKPLPGTLVENNENRIDKLKENLNQLIKKQATLNVENLMCKKDGSFFNVRCRKRPILNEVLKCVGISYLCEDITETKIWKQKLSTYARHDFLIADILNEEALTKRLEHDFNRAKRYNQPFSLLVIELKDIYDFANKGISFETGDTILKNVAEYCVKTFKNEDTYVGRFDKTKIGVVFSRGERAEAAQAAEKLYKAVIEQIRKLNIDQYNAEMIAVSYTDRKNFNDTADNMLGRVRRHIGNALRSHKYGIKSSDSKD